MADLQRPPPLAPGSRVHVIAPSSPFDRTRFEAGLALISERHRPSLGAALFAEHGFLAGPDEARLSDVAVGLADGAVRALVAARGGYGATRLLPKLAPASIRSANKWLVGFSDLTALHALWARAGLCSIHGPMVCSLASASPTLVRTWFSLLEGGTPPALQGLSCVRAGRAEGRLFGGNLTVLAALLGTPYLPSLEGTVLVLEDVAERPYRLDRTLTTMLQSGALAGVRAVVLGQFTDCPPGPDGTTALDVLADRLGALRIPILSGAPFGHIDENTPLLLGATARVDADAGTVRFEP